MEKIDIEIVNTLKFLNAYSILKHTLGISNEKSDASFRKGRKLLGIILKDDEKETITDYCCAQNLDFNDVAFYLRASIRGEIYTCNRYKRQIKRDNSQIYWKNEKNEIKYGIVQVYFKIFENIFVSVRELVPLNDVSNLGHSNIRFPNLHIPIRESYCLNIITDKNLIGKLVRIKDYIYVPSNIGKK